MKYLIYIGILVLCVGSINMNAQKDGKKQTNVLFIAVDDLRLQASVFGQEVMKTPTLDKLGEDGVAFNRAYCNVPVCGASRASLMSGIRPTNTRFLGYSTKKDEDAPNVPSIAKWFKKNGYHTSINGKIYHHTNDDAAAWSEEPFNPSRSNHGGKWGMYQKEENIEILKTQKKAAPFEDADVPDTGYPEGLLADKVSNDIERLSKQDKPFFLSVGFWDPHLPFNAPKKYWDLYANEDIKLADNPYKSEGAPDKAMHNWGELRSYAGISEKGPVDDKTAKKLVHGYYASVSYVDAQIGKLLNKLDELGLRENTIVVLWGDHGYHLGEHTLWAKHCNYDRVLRVPLFVSAPGYSKNEMSNSITELIDIYPSLCELADLPIPDHLDGTSFVPVLKDPTVSVKDYAYSRYYMGETVVSKDFNYTEWYDYKKENVSARMLYDLENDPQENKNISEDPSQDDKVKYMSNLLKEMRVKLSEK